MSLVLLVKCTVFVFCQQIHTLVYTDPWPVIFLILFDIEPPTYRRIFHIGTFYQTNLVVENIFAEPTEHSLWERFYMIVNPLLPLYRNQPINLHWKSMKWFLYNGKTGLKLVEEIKDPWNLSYSKVLYWPAYCVVKILAWLITVFMCGKSIVRRGVKIPHFG